MASRDNDITNETKQASVSEVVRRFNGLAKLEEQENCTLDLDEKFTFVTRLLDLIRAYQVSSGITRSARISTKADITLHFWCSFGHPSSYYSASIAYQHQALGTGRGGRQDIVATEPFHVPPADSERQVPPERVYRFGFRELLNAMGGVGRSVAEDRQAGRALRVHRVLGFDYEGGGLKMRQLRRWYDSFPYIETILARPDRCNLSVEEKLEFFDLTYKFLCLIQRDLPWDRISLEIIPQFAGGRGRREGTFAVMRFNALDESGNCLSQDFIAKTIKTVAITGEEKQYLWPEAVRVILQQLRRTVANDPTGNNG